MQLWYYRLLVHNEHIYGSPPFYCKTKKKVCNFSAPHKILFENKRGESEILVQ